MMNLKQFFTVAFFALFSGVVLAQEESVTVKITPIEGETVTVQRASTSSSSSCMTSDFPVYMGQEKTDVNFKDLREIYVRHDITASNPNNYISVELVWKDGKEGVYEMVKHIRFTGQTEDGSYSIKVPEVNMIQVVQGY